MARTEDLQRQIREQEVAIHGLTQSYNAEALQLADRPTDKKVHATLASVEQALAEARTRLTRLRAALSAAQAADDVDTVAAALQARRSAADKAKALATERTKVCASLDTAWCDVITAFEELRDLENAITSATREALPQGEHQSLDFQLVSLEAYLVAALLKSPAGRLLRMLTDGAGIFTLPDGDLRTESVAARQRDRLVHVLSRLYDHER